MQSELPSEQSPQDALTIANEEFARIHPGDSGRRQPIHTFYGGAHLFKSDGTRRLGDLAQRALSEYAPDPTTLASALDITETFAENIYTRIVDKLKREPIEDLRLDFEDGYGHRTDAEEDATADSAAAELAKGMAEGTLPPFIGIRIKPLNEEMRKRGLRTLDRFLNALFDRTGGLLPENFVVTLPKITVPEQVTALMDALDQFGLLRMEMMIETPQCLTILPGLLDEARGRCVAAHFGPYDYTASLGITAANQHLLHPACDFARNMMQTSLAGTGVWLSDGPTNIIPVGKHRGDQLTDAQRTENRKAVFRAWKLHCDHIRLSLYNAFYQSWDLHPAQLPVRYAAVYEFFLEGLESSGSRLRNFLDRAAQATMTGSVFDDAATGQGLLNFFLRAISCGAVAESDVPSLTGLSVEELRSASFAKILEGRRTAAV